MAKAKQKPAKGAAKEQPAGAEGIRLQFHPRAQRDIALAKGWGGLGVFALVVVLSLRAGLPLADAAWRAVLAGVAGYVVAWAIGVTVWRQLALAEIEAARRARLEAATAPAPERQAGGAERH